MHRGNPEATGLRNMNARQTKIAKHIGPPEIGFAAPGAPRVCVSDGETETSCKAELTPAGPQGGASALCHGPGPDAVGRLSPCLKIAPYIKHEAAEAARDAPDWGPHRNKPAFFAVGLA